MNTLAVILASVMGVFSCIICFFNCKNFLREYKKILELIDPVSNSRRNQIHPIPVANGVEVVILNEGIEVIDLVEVC